MTTSTREPTTCAWIRADICRHGGAICSKNSKIVPYHRCARIPRLTVSVPDYGSWLRTLARDSRKRKQKLPISVVSFIHFEEELSLKYLYPSLINASNWVMSLPPRIKENRSNLHNFLGEPRPPPPRTETDFQHFSKFFKKRAKSKTISF
jgi:hypothetical protein